MRYVKGFFESHTTGDVLRGRITRLTEFGAFVELFEGLEGLVHVSELSHERIEKPEDSFEIGQEVRVKIIKMDPVEEKIGLSIKGARDEPDPQMVQAYFDNQPGDGSATLGDVMKPDMFRTEAPAAEPIETTETTETTEPTEATETPAEETAGDPEEGEPEKQS